MRTTRTLLALLPFLAACGDVASGTADGGAPRDASTHADVKTKPDGEAGCQSGIASVRCAALAAPTELDGVLAIDDSNVYWASYGSDPALGGVYRMPLPTGSPVHVAPAPTFVAAMIADGSNVYWGDGECPPCAIHRVPVDGGAVVSLATTGYFACFAQDQDFVYWTDRSSAGSVVEVPKDGGAPVTLIPDAGSGTYAIAVDATNVYWVARALMSAPKRGGAPVTLLPGPFDNAIECRGIALAGGAVYLANTLTNQLVSVPVTGGAPTVVAADSPYVVVADPKNVFWLANQTEIDVDDVSLDGGPPVTLVKPQANLVQDMVVSRSGTLYWSADRQIQSLTP